MVTIDRYERLSPIGSGGFSQVYEAWQPEFNRKVAVKVLTVGAADDLDRRAFERECIAMGSVSEHPNIVTVYDSGFTQEGLPYLAMERYNETLLDRIKTRSFLPLSEVLELGVLMAGALQRAHSERMLHRDIKPQNIFYSAYDVPALADFGIASLASDSREDQSAGLTIHYAAPEILDGAPPTVESDIYSLGATLFTALAGHRPFARPGQTDSEAALTNRILTEPPPAITSQNVPTQADRAFRALLAKHPNDRPRTALEVASLFRDLQQRLGYSPTPIRVAESNLDQDLTIARSAQSSKLRSAGSASTSETDGTGSVTIARAKFAARKTDAYRVADEPNRGLWGVIALVGILVLAAGGAYLALKSPAKPDSASQTSVANQSPQTLPLPAPSTPTDIVITNEASASRISWTEVDGAERYRVSFLDAEGRTETVSEPSLQTDDMATGFCITIEAIGPTGKLSSPSAPSCSS